MNFRKLIFFQILTLSFGLSVAQQVQKVDTILTDETVTHVFLNLEVPAGEVLVKSSGICGTSISRLSAPDSFVRHHLATKSDNKGNQARTIRLESVPNPSARVASSSARMRFSEQITNFDAFSEKEIYKSEFHPDPSLSTDLFIDLGVGESDLDLSGLTLNKVAVNSAFCNVNVNYSEPNQCRMKKMDIHAASADILLQNLEMASADLVTIQNDMGATRLEIGRRQKPGSTIYIHSGVGSCTLMIHPDQPTQLTLKSGFFSTVDVPESFEETDKGVYSNKAYQDNPDNGTKIICNIDFGNISVIESK